MLGQQALAYVIEFGDRCLRDARLDVRRGTVYEFLFFNRIPACTMNF